MGITVMPLLLATGCSKLKARDQLNKGVQAAFDEVNRNFAGSGAFNLNLAFQVTRGF